MGLIEKAITKNRIKPKDAPANLPVPYLFKGKFAAAQVIRSAMFALAQKGDLTSSSHRGRDTLGIVSSMSSGSSTLWYSELNDRTWEVSLGLDSVRGKAIDWTVRIQVSEDGSSVAVTTPTVLTKDGTQVNRKQYQDFIDLAQTGLDSGHPPASDVEVVSVNSALVAAGIPLSPMKEGVEHQVRSWTTKLSVDEIEAMFDLVPFPIVRTDSGALVMNIGIDDGEEQTSGNVRTVDEGDHRRVHYSAEVLPTGSMVKNTIIVHRAVGAGALIGVVLRALDPDSHEDSLPSNQGLGGMDGESESSDQESNGGS